VSGVDGVNMIARGSILLGMMIALGAGAAEAGQKEDFLAACLKRTGGNAELCTCKADVAPKLIDARMMDYVILGMQDRGGGVPNDIQAKWNDYVAQSNRVCIPGY
jgi:hypothetical protein